MIGNARIDGLPHELAILAQDTSIQDDDRQTCQLAADEIERLRAALSVVREYPDFDEGGPFPEMMDQVLRGERAPMLEKLAEWQRSMLRG